MVDKILKKFKSENGFTGQDLIIALFILAMFLVFLLTVYTSIKSLSYEVKMNSKAAEVCSIIAEKLNSVEFDDEILNVSGTLTEKQLKDNYEISDLNMDIYQVNITVEDLEKENDTETYTLTKNIKIQVKYDLKGNFDGADSTEINLAKDIEIVRIEDYIQYLSDEQYTPIVAKSGKIEYSNALENVYKGSFTWESTDTDNPNWANYSYFDGFFCYAELGAGSGDYYVWLPRCGYVDGKLAFLYKDTNYPIVAVYSSNDYVVGYTVDRSVEASSILIDSTYGEWVNINNGNDIYTTVAQAVLGLNRNYLYK